jgi:hypothetical protein
MHTARDIGRTRPDTATDSNRLSGALPPCAHAEPPPDDGTILAMGRRFRSAVDRFTALDRQHAALPPDAPTEPVVRSWMQRADTERHRLFDRVFQRRAETLSDAAVLASPLPMHKIYQYAHTRARIALLIANRCPAGLRPTIAK